MSFKPIPEDICPILRFQKGMTFDHSFGYSFPLFSSPQKKEGKKKEKKKKKKVIKVIPYCSISGVKLM